MSETNVSNDPNLKIKYIVTENGLNKTYIPCPVLNVANNENMKLIQILDNNKPVTVNQPINVGNLSSPKPNDEFTVENIVYRVLRPEDLQLKVPPPENIPKSIKRPKLKKQSVDEETEVESLEIPKKVFRTRSGRMSKPPKHIQQEGLSTYTQQDQLLQILKSPTEEKQEAKIVPEIISESSEKKSSLTTTYKRHISSQYRCGTCKKAYLGQNKMVKHLQLNPGHQAPDFSKKSSELNLWPELLRKTKEIPKQQQSQLFCKEFVNLIYKARSVIPKLLKPAIKQEDANLTVDSIVSNALGIPEGNYSFDESVSLIEVANNDNKLNFYDIKEIEDSLEITESESVHNNDQNSLLNLLDTGQVTFDSSTNSEEVMNVDQLVNERLKTLTGGELDSSNSGNQNLNLDLSLDMFSFHGP